MALSLDSNASYNLITKTEDNRNKEIIFVKLTDSCVKAIEEFLRDKAATNFSPSICFDGSNGHLTIPSKGVSSRQDVQKKFNFSCSSLVQTHERHGVLECLQQPLQSQKTLSSIGQLQKKINIMGTEDAYEMTRTRMAQVDKEKKEVRTKEIRINHVKKGVKKPHVIPPVNSKLLALSNKKKPPVSSAPNGSLSVGSESLKDRVIHLLALKPLKKVDVLARLQRDGMNPKDCSPVGSLLEQVATLHDNTYKLHRRFYNELRADMWPNYSEAERQAVKRTIANMKRQDASPTVSSTTKSPEERSIHKRVTSDHSIVPAKKPRTTTSPQDIRNNNTTTVPRFQKETKEKLDMSSKLDIKRDQPEMKKPQLTSQEKPQKVEVTARKESPPVVASTSKSPDYLSKYTAVTSYEQRCKYKQDFQEEYSEYIKLKENIDAIRIKFMELDRSWKRCNPDSTEAKKIQEEIYRLYEKHQKDDKYREMKKRFQELHDKLSHIKQLVVNYDKSTMEEGT